MSNTPTGEPVNNVGCGLSQIDSDNDGVTDDQDAFPDDPTEVTDSDGDGVGDAADFYPKDASRSVPEGGSQCHSGCIGHRRHDCDWCHCPVIDATSWR